MASDAATTNQAARLFESFHDRAPRGDELVQLGGFSAPVTALEIGPAISVAYRALGDGKDYYHEFSGLRRPRVFVSADGRQLYFVGGIYRFTDRGILR